MRAEAVKMLAEWLGDCDGVHHEPYIAHATRAVLPFRARTSDGLVRGAYLLRIADDGTVAELELLVAPCDDLTGATPEGQTQRVNS
ncbi:hypothetical protein [Micromonospora sp. CA-244673]|uniref:hypothetical protein n=1 Tax=Micromonospora sp. CA-244673 TaxID=3239958 RepID=UPI003D8DEB28